jgi:predicted PurR-regulated permease PerM
MADNLSELEEKLAAAEENLKSLEDAERAIDSAFNTGKADRAEITRGAHDHAEEAVRLVAVAMEADEMADDAARMSVIASRNSDQAGVKRARAREAAARKQAKADHKSASKAAKQAYDAIRFSAPNKLGFMRVIQIMFLLHIFSTLLVLWMTSRDAIAYNSGTLFDWVMIILEGVAFWMFVNQYKIAKPYVIGVGAIGVAYHIIMDIVNRSFSFGDFLMNTVFYFILIFYFLFSKRVDYVMVNDFSKHEGFVERDEFEINRKGWPFYRNLIMYFVIFSVFGHWMEAGMCQFIILGWVEGEYDPTNTMLWRDWLYPFPMEGMAVVIIAVALYPLYMWLKKKYANKIVPYVLSFLANALTCSIIEFTMGLLINSDYQLWDYRENFGNVMGQVCLQNAVAFGVAASIIAWFVYPLMERWIARVRPEIMNIVFVVIAVFGGILWSLYIIDPPESLTEAQVAQQQMDAEEQKAQDEKDGYVLQLVIGQTTAESMRSGLEESQYLTAEEKAQLSHNFDEIQRRYAEMAALLGGEEAVDFVGDAPAEAAPAEDAVASDAGAEASEAPAEEVPAEDSTTEEQVELAPAA